MIYLITVLTDFAGFLVVFTVMRQLAEQQADARFVGLVGALFAGAAVVTNGLAGVLSDRLGRRPVALAGGLLLTLSIAAVAILEPGHGWQVAAYAVFGASLGLIYPPLIAALGRGRTGRAALRAYLAFCIAFNVGIASGQATAGWLFNHAGQRSPLYAACAVAVLIVVLLVFFREAPDRLALDAPIDPALFDPPRAAEFSRYCWIANIGGTFSYSIVLNLFPKLTVALGVPADYHGVILGLARLVSLTLFCVMYASHFWVYRFAVSLLAQLLGILGLIGLALADSLLGLLAGLAGLALLGGFNYYAGLFYSTTRGNEAQKGAGSGIHEATLALGLAGGSLCGGFAGAWRGDRAPFVLAALVVAALAVPQIVLWSRRRHS